MFIDMRRLKKYSYEIYTKITKFSDKTDKLKVYIFPTVKPTRIASFYDISNKK